MAIIIKIIFFLFKIKPKIPIKNKNNERFIVKYFCLKPNSPCNNWGILIYPRRGYTGAAGIIDYKFYEHSIIDNDELYDLFENYSILLMKLLT
jgi:hypothetical protein